MARSRSCALIQWREIAAKPSRAIPGPHHLRAGIDAVQCRAIDVQLSAAISAPSPRARP